MLGPLRIGGRSNGKDSCGDQAGALARGRQRRIRTDRLDKSGEVYCRPPNHIPDTHIALPAFVAEGAAQISSGYRSGLQSFDSGGTVKGDYLGQRVMVQARVGEQFSMGGRGGGGDIHIHIDQGAYIDGPSVDRLANLIAQRLSYATGR